MGINKTSSSVTLVDVAREAGVSLKTASRVLNREISVSRNTLENVQRAMIKLGYRPNELARGLKARKSATIGMVVKNLADPFAFNAVKAVQEVARANGYIVILASSGWDPEVERSEVESLIRHQVAGLIISPVGSPKSTFPDIIPPGFHVVTLDQPMRNAPFDSVMIDNRQSARNAVQHLLEHGYDRILALSTRPWLHTSKERIAGYRDAMRKAGFEARVALVEQESSITREWLDEVVLKEHKADALISMNWVCTIAALRRLKQNGKRLGKDVAFVSFDDFDLADMIRPTVSAVRQPTEEFGYEAARLLFQRLKGTGPQTQQCVVLPTKFIPRESCGCRPSDEDDARRPAKRVGLIAKRQQSRSAVSLKYAHGVAELVRHKQRAVIGRDNEVAGLPPMKWSTRNEGQTSVLSYAEDGQLFNRAPVAAVKKAPHPIKGDLPRPVVRNISSGAHRRCGGNGRQRSCLGAPVEECQG